MAIPFSEGEFVCSKDSLNYQAVLDDFKNAKQIRVLTYNISKKNYSNVLIDALKSVPETADVQIITNIPSRYKNYYNSYAGNKARETYQQTLRSYLDILNPENFQSIPYVGFIFSNHAKIIGTDNIVYIGSANYSDESKDNIESGTLVRDKLFIQKLYSEVFPEIMNESTPYFEDDFNVLRLFIVSMENKFWTWSCKFQEGLICKNPDTQIRSIANTILFDGEDVEELAGDLDELIRLRALIENTYTETEDEYNDLVDEIQARLDDISLAWMSDFVGTDSDFYNVITYDEEGKTYEYLQEYPDAYDENLDYYMEKAMSTAHDEYEDMKSEIEDDLISFYDELNKIVELLIDSHEKIMCFSNMWINAKIDNT